MAYDIGAKIALEGEASFRQALRGVNSQLKALSSEMKSAMSEFDAADRSEQKLTKRNDVLQRSIRATGDKVEILTKQYNKQKSELDALEKALNKANAEYGENSKEAAKAQNAYNKQVEVVNRLATNLNDATAELNQMNRELSANEQELRNMGNSAGDAGNGFGSLKAAVQKAMDGGKGKVSSMCDELAGQGGLVGAVGTACKSIPGIGVAMGAAAAVGIAAIGKLADCVKDTAKNLVELGDNNADAMNQLQASTGATAEEMQKLEKVTREVYKDGFGESMNEVADAVAIIRQQVGDLSEKEMASTARNAIALSDAFDMDVNESVRAANSLMKQFGITSDEAYNLIAQGAQNGLNQNGDLLDVVNEYAVQFKELGYSADDMFNMLVNGAKEGTWSVDKLGDAVKEYNIRWKDTTSHEALKKLGFNVDEMSAKMQAGGETAGQAMQEVMIALSQVEDENERTKIGVELMGTMWEDLGEKTVLALSNTEGEISKTRAAMDMINEIKYNTARDKIEQLRRTIEDNLTAPIAERLAPVIGDVAEKLEDAFDDPEMQAAIGDIADAIGDLIEQLGDGAIEAIPEIADFLKSVAENAPAAVEGFQNVAGALKFVGDLTSSMTTGTFPQFVAQQITSSETAQGAWSAFKDGVGGIIGQLVESWEGFKESQAQVFKRIASDFDAMKSNVVSKAGELKNGAVNAFSQLATGAYTKFNSMKTKAFSVVGSMLSGIKSKFDSIKSAITSKINAAKDAVSSAISKIKNAFNFKWSLPKLKLPHISVTGGVAPFGIGGKGSLPKFSISWYAKGGILKSPTIFGMNGTSLLGGGEAGAEAVIPLSELWKQMEDKMFAFADKIIEHMNEMYANTIDEERLARLIGQEIAKHSGGNNVTNNYFANGASSGKSRKELWRQKKRMGLV